jgi:hypothetical protein
MNETRYARPFYRWKNVGNARKMFQKIIGIDRVIFQKVFWNFDSRSSRKKLEMIARSSSKKVIDKVFRLRRN